LGSPLIRRKFYVGTQAAILASSDPAAQISAVVYPNANDTVGTVATWTITSYRGEKTRRVPVFGAPDTGLTDGTPSQ
jgi:hypothetical protein